MGGRKNSCVTLTDLLIRYIITTQHLDKLYTFVYIRILGYYNDIFLYENFIIIAFFVAFFAYSVLKERMILIWQITVTQIYMFMVRKRSWQTSLKKLKCWTRKDERKERTPFGSGWIGFIAQGVGMQAFDNRASVETFQYDGLPVYEVKREA